MTTTTLEHDDDGPRPRPANRKILCVDFIEDQMRCRTVAVFVAFAMFLVVGAELIRARTEPSFEAAGNIFFASQLPTSGFLGTSLVGGRATKLAVVSTLGTAFVRRECPAFARGLRLVCAQL